MSLAEKEKLKRKADGVLLDRARSEGIISDEFFTRHRIPEDPTVGVAAVDDRRDKDGFNMRSQRCMSVLCTHAQAKAVRAEEAERKKREERRERERRELREEKSVWWVVGGSPPSLLPPDLYEDINLCRNVYRRGLFVYHLSKAETQKTNYTVYSGPLEVLLRPSDPPQSS